MGEHSPLPWKIEAKAPALILTASDEGVAVAYITLANAAYIVQACNAFPQLKAAIQSVLTAIAASRSGDGAPANWIEVERELLAAMESVK